MTEIEIESLFRNEVAKVIGSLTPKQALDLWRNRVIALPQYKYLTPMNRLYIKFHYSNGVSLSGTPKENEAFYNPLMKFDQAELVLSRLINKEKNKNILKDVWFRAELLDADKEVKVAIASDDILYSIRNEKKISNLNPLEVVIKLSSVHCNNISLIRKMANSKESLIRAAVARNEATPVDILDALCSDPDPLVNAYSYIRIASKNNTSIKKMGCGKINIKRIFSEIRNRLNDAPWLKNPRDKFWWIVCDMADIWLDNEYSIRFLVSKLSKEEFLSVCLLVSKSHNLNAKFAIGKSAHSPIELLEKLSVDSNPWVRSSVGSNCKCPSILIEKLSSDLSSDVRSTVAANPATPLSILELLAVDSQFTVRTGVARNISTPLRILEGLSKDSNYEVRAGVASNVNISKELMSILCKDSYDLVGYYLAVNPSTDIQILEKLAESKFRLVLSGVAGNPRTPKEILDKLSNSKSTLILEGFIKNKYAPNIVLEKLAKRKNFWKKQEISLNPNASLSLLKVMLRDESPWVRMNAASNSSIPADNLLKLSVHKDKWIRCGVAINLATPFEVIENLVNDIDWQVSSYCVNNPNAFNVLPFDYIDIVKRILQEAVTSEAVENIKSANSFGVLFLNEIKNDDLDYIKDGIKMLELFSDNGLEKNLVTASASSDWLTRMSVALHPQSTKAILDFLTQDGDQDVAIAAQNRVTFSP